MLGNEDEFSAPSRRKRRAAARRRLFTKLSLTLALVAANAAAGASLFHFGQGVAASDALYAALVTMLTIGYGDVAFTSPTTRLLVSLSLVKQFHSKN